MKKTPLYDLHESLGARIVDFGGWLLPVQYDGVLAEHNHCRSQAAVFDTCHMGLFLFSGENVAVELGKICTQDAENLSHGTCKYGFLLNENGRILDDSILMVTGEKEYLLVVNAATADGDRQWILSHLPDSVEMTDLSAEGWGKIDLQGPASYEILSPLVEDDLGRAGEIRAQNDRPPSRHEFSQILYCHTPIVQ